MTNTALEDSLYDHVLGTGSPCETLISQGKFPEGWVTTYLELVAKLTAQYAGQSMLPRRIVWAVHFASWYLPLRYDVWCKTNGDSNKDTVGQLSRLRAPSEIFKYGANHEAGH